ncbi:hypothetical protein PRLR5107_27360 [Prevotella lacticifex]|uniref:Uncharacterized protein n=1 Tax=Prevotella lacticifex TaxID=2854755 RepID=A0A9R1C8S2_9BACT|nr:hypothetical protein PRLR5003_27400 [Prevotella lacticifex]GJG41191.1 hypothetical protein PRLR5019_31620 [Prevotella lacticifex]GJG43336.1 hypothetical protein PRLR5025_21220 [Prevotella lacticifex]GJG46471.1 hypothetical protein PRLR5027_20660 [Prevotella lacticifex]GJG50231.1 hypothetical protein PRLR5052_26440 [Prevotella lacticifex]
MQHIFISAKNFYSLQWREGRKAAKWDVAMGKNWGQGGVNDEEKNGAKWSEWGKWG